MSEWLDIMLGELERRQQEDAEAAAEANRRARSEAARSNDADQEK